MTIVVLGLASALLYGVSDHFGGLASRTAPAMRVAASALLVSTVVALPALLIGPTAWSWAAVGWAAVAGAAGGVGVLLLYAGLAAGPVGFVAPGVALLTAALPVLWAAGTGEPLGAAEVLALAAVVAGGVLIGIEPDVRRRPAGRTIALTVTTGVLYAAYFVCMGRTPRDSGAVPLVVESATAAAVVAVLLLARGRRTAAALRPARRSTATVIAAGTTQGVASILLVFALHLPGLAIVAALSAVYPIATVLLAVIVLHERVRPHQVAGIAVAVGGVALLALLRT